MGQKSTAVTLDSKIGLCAQANHFWEYLTLVENLQVMARVKGLTEKEFRNNAKLILQILELSEYYDVLA